MSFIKAMIEHPSFLRKDRSLWLSHRSQPACYYCASKEALQTSGFVVSTGVLCTHQRIKNLISYSFLLGACYKM